LSFSLALAVSARVVGGLSGVESDSFRPFHLHDSGVMHNNLHHSEPDRIDMLFPNPEPIDRFCSGFARLRFVGRYQVSSRAK
jgi:hypothetical protein